MILTLLAFAIARAADVNSTILALNEKGTREKNQITVWLASRIGMVPALLVKSVVLIALVAWALNRWPEVKYGVWILTVASLAAAANNARIWLRKRAERKA